MGIIFIVYTKPNTKKNSLKNVTTDAKPPRSAGLNKGSVEKRPNAIR